jgi:thioredoxin 1
MSANTTELTVENFDSTVASSKTPVLVDFWAPWCGPCKAIGPVLEELGSELAGKLTIGKLNVDNAGEIAGRYNIRAIPTMILFKGGQAVETIVGLVDKAGLKARLAGKI